MRTIWIAILIVTAICVLMGCGGGDSTPPHHQIEDDRRPTERNR